MSGRPRAVVDGLPQYKPGKSAAQAAADHQLVEAIKLASNESSYGPLPSVLEAVADQLPIIRSQNPLQGKRFELTEGDVHSFDGHVHSPVQLSQGGHSARVCKAALVAGHRVRDHA